MKNTKQPGSKVRTAFETVEPFQKRDEDVLNQIFRLRLLESQTASSSKQGSRVFGHGLRERFRITLSEPVKKIRADRGCGPHIYRRMILGKPLRVFKLLSPHE